MTLRTFVTAMASLSNLNKISALSRENVHIRDKTELLQKLNKMIQDGHNKLQIVTDFDHTLTRHTMDNGSVVLTSFGKPMSLYFLSWLLQPAVFISLLKKV